MNLLKEVKILRGIAPTAAGTTDINGVTIDSQGAESVTFCLILGDGTDTGTVKLKAQSGLLSDASDMADITGAETAVATSTGANTDNKILLLEIVKPTKRYVRMVADRGVANHVLEGGTAMLKGYHRTPVSQGDSLSTVVANG